MDLSEVQLKHESVFLIFMVSDRVYNQRFILVTSFDDTI